MACGGDGAYAHAQRLWSELKDAVICFDDDCLDPKVPRILGELGPARIAALQDADEELGENGLIGHMLREHMLRGDLPFFAIAQRGQPWSRSTGLLGNCSRCCKTQVFG